VKRRKINRYSPAFKERAMKLAEEIGCSRAAQLLGIKSGTLGMMLRLRSLELKSANKKSAEDKKAVETAVELRKLRKENEELKKANLVLKEVASLFSKGPLPTSLGWPKASIKRQA
jgi:transposase-like protein